MVETDAIVKNCHLIRIRFVHLTERNGLLQRLDSARAIHQKATNKFSSLVRRERRVKITVDKVDNSNEQIHITF